MGREVSGSGMRPEAADRALLRAVDRACASRTLAKSVAQRQVLRFLARHAVNGNARGVSQHALAAELLGRAARSFDPGKRSRVRVVIGRLRVALKSLYERELIDEPNVLVIPRRDYLLRLVPRESPDAPAMTQTPAATLRLSAMEHVASHVRTLLHRRDADATAAAIVHLERLRAEPHTGARVLHLLALTRLVGVHLDHLGREHLGRACEEACLAMFGDVVEPACAHEGLVGSPYTAPGASDACRST